MVLPHQQRSWIGKAHFIDAAIECSYFRPGTLHEDDGTTHSLPRGSSCDGKNKDDEWVLINSTPASCVQIGLYHLFQERGPIDLVLSGPNYGRNTTALFALSSGTIGAAMEGALSGKRSIALSYAFKSRNHDPVIIAEASQHAVRLVEHLVKNWEEGVDLYNVNVPLESGVSKNKILYTNMLANKWAAGSCFKAVDASVSGVDPATREQELRENPWAEEGQMPEASGTAFNKKHFVWAPDLSDVLKSVEKSAPGNDGWAVKEGMTRSVGTDICIHAKAANSMQCYSYAR